MGLLKDIIKEGWFRRGKTESLSIDEHGWKELFEKKTTIVINEEGTAFQISVPDGKSIDSLTEKDLEIVELPYVPDDKGSPTEIVSKDPKWKIASFESCFRQIENNDE